MNFPNVLRCLLYCLTSPMPQLTQQVASVTLTLSTQSTAKASNMEMHLSPAVHFYKQYSLLCTALCPYYPCSTESSREVWKSQLVQASSKAKASGKAALAQDLSRLNVVWSSKVFCSCSDYLLHRLKPTKEIY